MSVLRTAARLHRHLLVSILALHLAVPAAAAAGAATRVYAAQGRPAEELVPLAETALGTAGRAVVDRATNSVVLIGDEGAVAEAYALLERQDRRLRSVVLRYESRSLAELEAAGIDVDWSVDAGGVRVGNVVRPRGGSGARILGGASRRERGQELAGVLRIAEGESGRLLTGSAVPVTRRTVQRGRLGPTVTESTQWVNADSGFDASVRILGDGRVRVELQPFEADVRDGRIRSAEAATTLVISPGETVALGAIDRASTSRGIDLPSGAHAARARGERVLLLGAEVE